MMSQPYNHIRLFGWKEIYWSIISSSSVNPLAVCPLFHNFYLPLDERAGGKAKLSEKILIRLFLHWISILVRVDAHVSIKFRERNFILFCTHLHGQVYTCSVCSPVVSLRSIQTRTDLPPISRSMYNKFD